jgi:hypothetical protein
MKFTNVSVRSKVSRGLRRALVIDQLRLQSQVSKPFDRNSRVSWVDFHAVADAAELLAGNERGAGAAEGIVVKQRLIWLLTSVTSLSKPL